MGAAWIGDEWRVGKQLELSAGVRLHLFSVLGGAPYYLIDKDGNITETLNTATGHIVKTYTNVEPRLSAKM